MRRSNCIAFAVALYLRRRAKGRWGHVLIRRSHWGPFPHFLYQEGRWIVSYVPVSPSRRLVPPPLFQGRVRWGDPPPEFSHVPAR